MPTPEPPEFTPLLQHIQHIQHIQHVQELDTLMHTLTNAVYAAAALLREEHMPSCLCAACSSVRPALDAIEELDFLVSLIIAEARDELTEEHQSHAVLLLDRWQRPEGGK
jgi:hypothetical protein